MIKVSLIIPNLNRINYLNQALDSIINQSYSNWEAIVVDDGSTDGSKTVITELSKEDNRIKLIERTQEPKGAAHCRNIGIKLAKGEFVIFLDSDDILAPYCLENRVHFMQNNPDIDFAVFKMQFFKEEPGDDQRLWNLENETNTLQRFLNLDSVWQTSGPIWKTGALKTTGGFNENLKCWQDFDIHLKALFSNLHYKINYDLPVDCYYRKDAKQTISQTNMNTLSKLKSKTQLYNWVKPLAQEQGYKTHNMLIQILVSALLGHQIQFFEELYQQEKQFIETNFKKKLQIIKWIKLLRLDRVALFKKFSHQLVQSFIQESYIGQFKEI